MTKWESTVAGRIRKCMKNRKVTQQELADALGVKQYSVSRMLSGAPFFDAEQLLAVAERLDISLYYLLGVKEQGYRELTPKAREVADAYQSADPTVQAIIDRILEI